MADDSSPDSGFRSWFAEVKQHFDSPERAGVDLAAEAGALWVGYPRIAEAIECSERVSAAGKWSLRQALNGVHYRAVEWLMLAAERNGIDPVPLSESRRVCQEVFAHLHSGNHRDDVPRAGPYGVYWFHHSQPNNDHWPDCLGPWRYALPPAMQEAIRLGEEVFTRLRVKLDLVDFELGNIHPLMAPAADRKVAKPASPLADLLTLVNEAGNGLPPLGVMAMRFLAEAGGEMRLADLNIRMKRELQTPDATYRAVTRAAKPWLRKKGVANW
jgi:hypothetical protein